MEYKVFISYSWESNSEKVVQSLCSVLERERINFTIDRKDLKYKDDIKEFMDDMGRGRYIIVVVSDKYLKSPYCMYEMLQIKKNGDFYKRIFPIVLEDAKIFTASSKLEYVKYWEEELDKINSKIKEIKDISVLEDIHKENSIVREILNITSEITSFIGKMNTITPEHHLSNEYEDIISLIRNENEKNDLNDERKLQLGENYLVGEDLFKGLGLQEKISDSEKKYQNRLKFRRKIYNYISEIEKSIFSDPKYNSIFIEDLFKRIVMKECLNTIEIVDIREVKDSRLFKWYERYQIVSALTVSICKFRKFDGKKIELLLSILLDKEEKVWRNALVGLIIGTINHDNRLSRFWKLVKN